MTAPKSIGERDVLERFRWRRVEAPRRWYPKEPGEELVGYYGGRTVKHGAYGQYEVALIHVPMRGAFTISGVKIIQLLDAAAIRVGWPVRIVWKGEVQTGKEHSMKDFEVHVADGDPLAEDSLPQVSQ